jgi:inositol hexakisphosphate/diphosphoinositol-pentakisphosphate kinase
MLILSAVAPHRLLAAPAPPPLSVSDAAGGGAGGAGADGGAGALSPEATARGAAAAALAAAAAGPGAATGGGAEALDGQHADEELRCVLAVVRHGDRTPKQKMKMRVTAPPLLGLLHRYMDSKGKQAKLKSPLELQELLDVTRALVEASEAEARARAAAGARPDAEADEARERLRIVRSVLEQGGQFAGINRKVQLKPLAWAEPEAGAEAGGGAAGGTPPPRRAVEALLILKHGGVLTHAGRAQAQALGQLFRASMYPHAGPAGGGLLRLHSTYRHDLKIYSSDEGRVQVRLGPCVHFQSTPRAFAPLRWLCLLSLPTPTARPRRSPTTHSPTRAAYRPTAAQQMSAAAFTKGLLDLEGGALTPILVSLVKKDAGMLDAFGKGASADILAAKAEVYAAMTRGGAEAAAPPAPSPPSSPPPAGRGGGVGGGGAAAAAVQLAAAAAAAGPPRVRPLPADPPGELRRLRALLAQLVDALRQRCLEEPRPPSSGSSGNGSAPTLERPPSSAGAAASAGAPGADAAPPTEGAPCGGERLLLMFDRWRKLAKAFYDDKRGAFDISKVPDIYDAAKWVTVGGGVGW